jgi:hypothetical protein
VATVYKRLGAAAGNGTIATASTLYTVPALTATVISTITICNTSATAGTFSISVSTTTSFISGQEIVYQAAIAGNDTIGLTFGATLDATNKYLLVSSSAATVMFSVFGSEIA